MTILLRCFKKYRSILFFQRRPETYIWLLFGVPVLCVAHGIVFIITWISVILIPVAKVGTFSNPSPKFNKLLV